MLGDQINNAKRLTETGYGYSLDLLNYTEEELLSTVEKKNDKKKNALNIKN